MRFFGAATFLFVSSGLAQAGSGKLPENFLKLGEEDRVAALAPIFQPSPFESAVLDSPEQQKIIAGTDVPPERLHGYIRVNPPKGTCIKIERLTQESDPAAVRPPIKVCKPEDVPFRLGEMDEFSELTWIVRVNRMDQGTRVSWRLPYRIAFVVPYAAKLPAEPVPIYIRSCEASISAEMGRRVFVNTFSGERWFIRFPSKDYAMDSGADFNLDTGNAPLVKNGFGFRVARRRSKVLEEREARKNPNKKPVKKVEAKPAKKAAKATPTPTPEPSKGPFQPTDYGWKISRFNSFYMNASNFMPDGAVTPGMKGDCRYTFETSGVEYPEGGLIECHGPDRFSYVYLPLNCLRDKNFRAERVEPPKKEEPTPVPVATPKPH